MTARDLARMLAAYDYTLQPVIWRGGKRGVRLIAPTGRTVPVPQAWVEAIDRHAEGLHEYAAGNLRARAEEQDGIAVLDTQADIEAHRRREDLAYYVLGQIPAWRGAVR